MLLNANTKKMHGALSRNVFYLVLLLFVLVARCAIGYVLLVVWHSWKGPILGLMAKSTLASIVNTLGK